MPAGPVEPARGLLNRGIPANSLHGMSLRHLVRQFGPVGPLLRTAAAVGGALALVAGAVSWVTLQHSVRLVPTELYILVIAIVFTLAGIWVGHAVTSRPRAAAFARNDDALRSLGITGREYEVLTHLAGGRSNKEIARELGVSPNTVKSQVSSLFAKLSAARRTEAVGKARDLSLIP
jgi:NarL family two-component system response regulator LiaR